MRIKPALSALASLLVLTCFAPRLRAQEKCPAPPALTPSHEPNFFSPKQEVDLGDIEAAELEKDYQIVHDDALYGYVNTVLQSLVSQMPDTGLQFRVAIIDLPEVNSLSLPGGRIYITRKMIAFLRNEDELAGLLGHEMGHILTHQGAIEMTSQLHSVLGVTSVGDRKDIFDKFNLLLDNAERNPKIFVKIARQEEPDQYEADQVALYLAANAGYSPQSFVDFLDRLANIQGKIGNRLTDFLGSTTPDQKRLRLLLQSQNALPRSCERTAAPPSQQFGQWQSAVLAYSTSYNQESLYGLLSKQTLSPRLRVDLTNLKFSPNGQYVLGQDDSSVFVLIRTPFALLFRIDAPDGENAQFSPDSQRIVFVTKKMRVESWSITERKRLSAHEMTVQKSCAQMLLSPDGNTLACLNTSLEANSWDFDLSLFDVNNSTPYFEKKFAWIMDPLVMFELALQELNPFASHHFVDMEFSPDSKYFAVGGLNQALAYDLQSRAVVPLHGELDSLMRNGFAFLGPERVIARDATSPQKSAVMDFPSGKLAERLPIQEQKIIAPAQGDYVILEPATSTVAAGVLDLSTLKYVVGDRISTALDVYNHEFVTQNIAGDIVINDLASKELLAKATIPDSPLGGLRARAVSSDLHWLAVSGSNRGAVWDLSNGKRAYYVRGFQGAYLDSDKGFYADFPTLDASTRNIGHGDLKAGDVASGLAIDDKSSARQYGKYLFTMPSMFYKLTKSKDNVLKVQNSETGDLLWSKPFLKEVPDIFVNIQSGTTIFEWQCDEDAAKDEIKSDPSLQSRFSSSHDSGDDYLLDVVDTATGKPLGNLLVGTGRGSVRLQGAYASGDWVVVTDQHDRTLVYSLKTGEQKGTFFGTVSEISDRAGLFTVESQDGKIDVYALPDMEQRGELLFPARTSLEAYSEDGKRFLVLTANQTAYTFDTSLLARGSSAGIK